MRPVDMNAAIEKTLLIMESQLLLHQVAVETRLDPSLPKIPADEGKLRQVFANIILNAADAMPGGGSLEIATRLDADKRMAVISFQDTGGGIPKELLSRIFDPFFSTKGAKGTGLGLAISYGIIQQHGGSIAAFSQEGRGASFTITLPIESKNIGHKEQEHGQKSPDPGS
jgi:two-component system NtrC family sensor kinase